MKLLCEQTCPDVSFQDMELIIEQTNVNRPTLLKIKGVFIACNVKNANGRIYDFNYFDEFVIPEYRRTWIDQNRAYSELSHRQSHQIDPAQACDIVTSLVADR